MVELPVLMAYDEFIIMSVSMALIFAVQQQRHVILTALLKTLSLFLNKYFLHSQINCN